MARMPAFSRRSISADGFTWLRTVVIDDTALLSKPTSFKEDDDAARASSREPYLSKSRRILAMPIAGTRLKTTQYCSSVWFKSCESRGGIRHRLSGYTGYIGQWRRGWDSNPRSRLLGTRAFQARLFGHSSTSPFYETTG